MNRNLRNLVRSGIAAWALIAASALAALVRDPFWGASTATLVLVGGLLAIDWLRPRSSGRRSFPTLASRILLGGLLGACGLLLFEEPSRLPSLIPILGTVLVLPILEDASDSRVPCS